MRFHRFEEANALLDQALAAGHPKQEIDTEKAALLQATGRYREALALRERMAKAGPAIHTLGALASLLAGSTIVLYDGSPGWPNLDFLWEFAEKTRINHFGTSAPFITACQKAGLRPNEKFDLSNLKSIGSRQRCSFS